MSPTIDRDPAKQADHQKLVDDSLTSIRRLLLVILLLLLGAALYFGKLIAMPIVLGLLISFTLSPLTRALTRFLVPAPLAAVCVIGLVASSISAGAYLLADPFATTVERLPDIKASLERRLAGLESSIDTVTEISDEMESLAGNGATDQVMIAQPGILSAAATSVASGLTSFALASLLALFLLSSGNLFDEKLVASFPQLTDKKRALRIMRDIERKISTYLLTITLINITLGTAIGLLLAAYGKQDPAFWGALAALLNFLPYLGAVLGASLIAIISIAEYPTLTAALIPPAIYYVCSAIEGNLITPLVVGRHLELNVVAVFVFVVIWSWLWGVAGALMAVPILVTVKVICEHLTGWHTFGRFLSARDGAA